MAVPVSTPNAPAALGPYSQAVRAGNTVYLSGQIPLDPATGELVSGGFEAQVHQSFRNLKAVVEAAGGHLGQVVRLGLFLTDLAQFATVNTIMPNTSRRRIRPARLFRWRRCPRGRHSKSRQRWYSNEAFARQAGAPKPRVPRPAVAGR